MKAQEISWKKCNGNNQYIDDDFEKWVSFASKVFLDAFCAMLFVGAARRMISDVYYWGTFNGENLFRIFFLAIIIGAVMEFGSTIKNWIGYAVQWGVLIVGTGIILHNILLGENTQYLLSGINKMISFYIDDWNSYYESALLYVDGRLIYVTESLDYVVMVLFFVFFWMSKMLKKNIVMIIMPVIVLVLELLVGHSPDYSGLLMMFIAILLSNTSKWATPDFCMAPGMKYLSVGSIRFFSWIAIAASVYVLCGIIKLAGTDAAQEILAHSGDVKEYYNELVDNVANSTVWELFDGVDDSRTTKLTNDSPKYNNEDILGLNINIKPEGNIYLKGYYAQNYHKGIWELDSTAFDEACQEAGFDSKSVSSEIMSLCLDSVLNGYGKESIYDTQFGCMATLSYYEKTGKKAYFPYFVEVESNDITIEGDGRYRKSSSINGVTFVMWQFESIYQTKMLITESDSTSEEEKWYREYVLKEYLDVPDNMTNVETVADELTKQFEGELKGQFWVNYNRLKIAEYVAKWMEENTRYSLNPPSLPAGNDPIEYFLGEGRVGYCMHYASASVMILRQLGVPARYASGYIVREDSFGGFYGDYLAKIQDNDAHAWVEIYLNGIGWVPIEVTKGYNESVMDDAPVNNATTKPNENTTTKPKETSEKETDEKESTSEKETAKENETTGSNKEPEGDGASGNGNGGNMGRNLAESFQKLLPFIGAFIALTLAVFGFIWYKEHFRERLQKEMKNERTLHAIKMINQRVYRKLRRTGKIMKFNIRDDEYKDVLIKNYPEIDKEDWELYMDIVKAAAFSKRDFTVEEMEFCYGVYCKVVGE